MNWLLSLPLSGPLSGLPDKLLNLMKQIRDIVHDHVLKQVRINLIVPILFAIQSPFEGREYSSTRSQQSRMCIR